MKVSEMSTYELLCMAISEDGEEWEDAMLELARRIDRYADDQKAAAEDVEAQRRKEGVK